MIPILETDGHYSIYIHSDVFPTFFVKYILTCRVGTRIKVFGETEEEGFTFLEFERIPSGFLYITENHSRRLFISKYVSKEWRIPPDEWCDMIYRGFTVSFPTLVIHTLNATLHVRKIRRRHDERRLYPKRFSIFAHLPMKPVRRTTGVKIFTSLNDIV
ncbi:hypothetical protein TNCT_707021 [Trichonephila clavata]|uniref:Uncharacterized protein n=1 Tax=Trichonephila clavata TaxID=2740835 RepID=A0A8X6G2E4_TRICU|nr:hypothetical protein TNCT_707021 [Trichonephila clavata]